MSMHSATTSCASSDATCDTGNASLRSSTSDALQLVNSFQEPSLEMPQERPHCYGVQVDRTLCSRRWHFPHHRKHPRQNYSVAAESGSLSFEFVTCRMPWGE